MRITNQTPVNSTDAAMPAPIRTDSAAPGLAPHLGSASAPAVSAPDDGLVPSFELQSLNALLAQVPPVRQDVLSETVQRLASGDLQGPSALEQTALAMLGH